MLALAPALAATAFHAITQKFLRQVAVCGHRAVPSAQCFMRHFQTYPQDSIYTSQEVLPSVLGASSKIALQHLPGKGLSLATTSRLTAGDDVMVVPPLAILHGPADDMPPPDGLVPILQQVTHDTGLQWLRYLFRGPKADQQHDGQQHTSRLDGLRGLLHKPLSSQETSVAQQSPAPAAPVLQQAAGLQTASLSNDVLEQVIAYNAFGDAYEDLAAHECRVSRARAASHKSAGSSVTSVDCEPEAQSHVGIWPQFALLNHSCLPTCVHYVVGSHMVVRAVTDVDVGQEVTISYLGREDFSPASIRQQILSSRYGFTCSCPRCHLEGVLPQPLSQLLHAIHQDVKINLGPALLRAVEEEDRDALTKVGDSLIEWSTVLHDALSDFKEQVEQTDLGQGQQTDMGQGQASSDDVLRLRQAVQAVGGPDAAVLCLEAAIYDFFELLHQHAALSPVTDSTTTTTNNNNNNGSAPNEKDKASVGPDPAFDADGDDDEGSLAALRLCADILHAVSRGSELHVFQTSRLLSIALSSKNNSVLGEGVAVAAAQAAEEALCCRYGHISPGLMKEMAERNAKISEEFLV